MSTTLISCPHTATIVRDYFAQCEICHLWGRLYDKDEYGKRTLPLFWIRDRERFKWCCENCHDRMEEMEESTSSITHRIDHFVPIKIISISGEELDNGDESRNK